ncbi:thioesterase family protein [Streptomyces sp. NPDC020742]|uniref:acyl-CoA thioesterase n=1 Tax=Streptomyces sp. NPDC020742 TaxID=3154897 RepID=UPI0033E2ACAB
MRQRVPFSDVDMHGHVHNGVYCAYAETAINEFLREAGLSDRFDPRADAHGVVYHVKKVELCYEGSAGFDDVLDITASVERIGGSSLTFSAVMAHAGAPGDAEEPAPVARAQVVWVCVDKATGRARPIPEPTRAALAAAQHAPATARSAAPGQPAEGR